MSVFTMIFLIVLVACVTGIVIQRYETLSRRQSGSLADERADELTREVTALRERIAVLERIATDNNTLAGAQTRRIAEEIEGLRNTEKTL